VSKAEYAMFIGKDEGSDDAASPKEPSEAWKMYNGEDDSTPLKDQYLARNESTTLKSGGSLARAGEPSEARKMYNGEDDPIPLKEQYASLLPHIRTENGAFKLKTREKRITKATDQSPLPLPELSGDDERVGKVVDILAESGNWKYFNGNYYQYDNRLGFFVRIQGKSDLFCRISNEFTADLRSCISRKYLTNIAERLSWSAKARASPDSFNNQGDRFINCLNGVLDLKEMKLTEHASHFMFTYVNRANFLEKEKLKMPTMEQFLYSSLGGIHEKIDLLFEITGYMFSPCIFAKKAPIIVGPPNNGKSSYLRGVLMPILGQENVSSIPLHELRSRFSNSQLSFARANLHFEMSREPLSNVDAFKAIVGGDFVKGEFKGKELFTFQHRAKLMFAGNYLPPLKTTEPSSAFIDRITLLTFCAVPQSERNLKLELGFKIELDAIFTASMYALKRLRDNGYRFTEDPESQKLLDSYSKEIDNVAEFYNQLWEKSDKKDKAYTRNLYSIYKKWCEINNLTPYGKAQFSSNFAATFGSPSKNIRVNGGAPAKGFEGLVLKKPAELS
jgi:P4 family phage/plasmid primase-like protien